MKLDIGRCLDEAWDVFLKNWLILTVAGLLYTVLSIMTLLIVMGPGTIISFATTPLAFLVVAAAYRQLTTAPPETGMRSSTDCDASRRGGGR
jgi:amino acid transporter